MCRRVPLNASNRDEHLQHIHIYSPRPPIPLLTYAQLGFSNSLKSSEMPPKPFKPPRPSPSSVKKSTKAKPTSSSIRKSTSSTTKSTSRTSGSSAFSLPALGSSSDEPDTFASLDKSLPKSQRRSLNHPEDAEDEEATILLEDDETKERIPPELLTKLLHENFKHEGTRISNEATPAVGKYMETFVREAIARAAHMRMELEAQTGGGDGFLEVCTACLFYFVI